MTIDLLQRHRKKSDDDFDERVWNAFVEDAALIMSELREQTMTFAEARQQMIQMVLYRTNEVLTPAFERVNFYLQAGFLDAPVSEGSEVSFTNGETVVGVHEDYRASFRPAPFVALVRPDTTEDWAVGRTLSYDAATGALGLDIVAQHGAVGPHSDVTLTATAGGVAGQIAFYLETKQLLAQAGGIIEAAESARDAAVVAKGGAQGARDEAVPAAAAAVAAKNKSQAWAEGVEPGGPGTKSSAEYAEDARQYAESAATFDPSGLQPRTEKGQPDGYASLDESGRVPDGQLPSAPGFLDNYYTKVDLDGPDGKIGKTDIATETDYRAGSAGKVLTADKVWSAVDFIDGGTISGNVSIAFGTHLNRKVIIGGNVTLTGFSGAKAGMVMLWQITHSGSNRTLSYNSAYFCTDSGVAIELSSVNGAIDVLQGVVLPTGKVLLTLVAQGVA